MTKTKKIRLDGFRGVQQRRYATPVSRYEFEVITLWAINAPDPQQLPALFEFPYDEDGDCEPSAFTEAYNIDWYDEDFAELHTGGTIEELIKGAAEYARTLDEQALSRIPQGEWNALYLLFAGAGEEWSDQEKRPPMPHGIVEIQGAKFKLVDTFRVIFKG